MRLAADACIAGSLVRALREAGYDVSYAMEGPAGIPDAKILADAFEADRLLLTEDHDFGSLAVREGRQTHGVFLIELYGLSDERRNQRVLSVLALGEAQSLGRFTVIEPSRTRSRSITPES
jgi:predicted nuclease of predicted toxin-antitoxin system